MKLLLALTAILAVTACSKTDQVILNDQSDRISELERRADLNDQLNLIQSSLIKANSDAIAAESTARLQADQDLADALAAEEAARIAGDQQQAAALALLSITQSFVNLTVQAQLASINAKFPLINYKLSSLQSQVNNLNLDIDDLEDSVEDLQVELADLEIRLSITEGDVDDLRADLTDTQTQLDQEGVKVYKCNAPNSSERILKINGEFYAVMNRVTTEVVKVITSSTSETFTNPKLCLKDEKAKLPGGSGNCPSSWTTVGGETVTVASYSTANKTVVTSAQVALDILNDGSYTTTDGGPACSFSISSGGTTSTNLIQVQ